MPASLFTVHFFGRLRGLMSPAGLLAVNYFGRRDGNLDSVLCALRSAGFRHVRAFAEKPHEGAGGHPGFITASPCTCSTKQDPISYMARWLSGPWLPSLRMLLITSISEQLFTEGC